MKSALITGIDGQDGSYLADLLLAKGYKVFGIRNPLRGSKKDSRCDVEYIELDLVDDDATDSFLSELQPSEVYHLASDVEPRVVRGGEVSVFNTNFIPGINLLNGILNTTPETKAYFAGSSLMFGSTNLSVLSESSPMMPDTPYGIAKVALYRFIEMYRRIYGVHVVCGILFNHESPRRSLRFLPRKITNAAARIKKGVQRELHLGNIDSSRDWCHAKDVVQSMWLMLQSDKASDFVVGSGELRSIKDVLDIAFGHVDLDWRNYVVHDPELVRLVDVPGVTADTRNVREKLGWKTSISFESMIVEMVEADMRALNYES